MTEEEWLNCEDSQVLYEWLMQPVKVTERKMRLVVAAAVGLLNSSETKHINSLGRAAEMLADGANPETVRSFLAPKNPEAYWATVSSTVRAFPQAFTCADYQRKVFPEIIRDIVLYPESTVALPPGDKCKKCRGKGTCPAGAGGAVPHRKLRLPCEACAGRGTKLSPIVTEAVYRLAEAAYSERLSTCLLDPERLAILSDALEEAGLLAGACLRCRGKGELVYTPDTVSHPCPAAVSVFYPSAASTVHWPEKISVWCSDCSGTGKVEHPVLKHLRSPGRHWRGMWSLDLVLGRS